MDSLREVIKKVKKASYSLANLDSEIKNGVLSEIADNILKNKDLIFKENEKDLKNALDSGLDDSLINRLKLTDKKIKEIVEGLKNLALMKDPVGRTLESTELAEGLNLYKVSTPLGVVAAIFESRPDALVQIFSLAFKSGNGSVLKGGKEAKFTNRILFDIITNVVDKTIKNSTVLLETREDVSEILKMDNLIDLIIPRGSNKFVKFIQENSKIPVLGHSEGLCHAYVDKDADMEKSLKVVFDAKTQYPAACNSIETLLIHKDISKKFLPLIAYMFKNKGVEMRGDKTSREIVNMNEATEKDWETEYNDLIISIKIVENINEAIAHINRFGSGHSELILTEDKSTAKKFERGVDASSIMWNCSTRFADGYRYGKGAETGISTGKIHARGPVGLEGLVIYKYILEGDGQTVAEQTEKGYTHKKQEREWKDS